MSPGSDRRRLRSSNPTGRPRKIAGQRPTDPTPVDEPELDDPELDDPELDEPELDDPVQATSEPATATEPEPEPAPEPAATPPVRRRRSRLLVALVAAMVVLTVVAVAEIVYLVRDPEPTVSSARPVVTGDVTARAAVDAAARSVEQILSTSYQDYDNQVAQATSKMTDAFAEQYRSTADGLADKYAAEKMKITVKAVDQGVAQASGDEVQALLFLNQYVEKVEKGQPKTGVAQYRALVTVVHTDHGWLVSNIETQ